MNTITHTLKFENKGLRSMKSEIVNTENKRKNSSKILRTLSVFLVAVMIFSFSVITYPVIYFLTKD